MWEFSNIFRRKNIFSFISIHLYLSSFSLDLLIFSSLLLRLVFSSLSSFIFSSHSPLSSSLLSLPPSSFSVSLCLCLRVVCVVWCAFVCVCVCVCGTLKKREKKTVCGFKNASVCTFKPSPCVPDHGHMTPQTTSHATSHGDRHRESDKRR